MIKTQSTSLSGQSFHQLIQFLVIFSGFIGWNMAYCAITVAQTSPLLLGELPPPPSMTQMNEDFSSDESQSGMSSQPQSIETIPYFESTPTTAEPESIQREYNFQSPQRNYYSVPNNYPPNATDKLVEFYRVEVIAEDKSLLSQIKQIEPFAYVQINEGAIYAGLFQEQQEAQQRVQQLINKGFSARIVSVNYSVSSSYSPVQH